MIILIFHTYRHSWIFEKGCYSYINPLDTISLFSIQMVKMRYKCLKIELNLLITQIRHSTYVVLFVLPFGTENKKMLTKVNYIASQASK